MRRAFILALLAALAVPATALAVTAAPGDGTLSVREGDGAIGLVVNRGAVIGRIGSGVVVVANPKNGDCAALKVWDDGEFAVPAVDFIWDQDDLSLQIQCRFKGQGLRFRLAGSDGEMFKFIGTNVGLSAVGKGSGWIRGAGGFLDGLYALNGGEYTSLPEDKLSFRLAADEG